MRRGIIYVYNTHSPEPCIKYIHCSCIYGIILSMCSFVRHPKKLTRDTRQIFLSPTAETAHANRPTTGLAIKNLLAGRCVGKRTCVVSNDWASLLPHTRTDVPTNVGHSSDGAKSILSSSDFLQKFHRRSISTSRSGRAIKYRTTLRYDASRSAAPASRPTNPARNHTKLKDAR